MIESSAGLQVYLHEISPNKVLTREEEVALFKQLEKGDESVRETIIECNLKFVIQIAHKFRSRGVPLEDLIQEGNLGLMEAVKKFNHRLGFRFSTYAAFWIRQAIQVAIRQRGSLIRLPVRKSRQLGFMSEIIQEYWSTVGRPPTEVELAKRLKITATQARELARMGEAVLSLDMQIDNEGPSLVDILPDTTLVTMEDRRLAVERKQKLTLAMSESLSEREHTVIEKRFGFKSGLNQSLRKVSAQLGLSQEGVRRIEQRAINKLRRPRVRQMMAGLL